MDSSTKTIKLNLSPTPFPGQPIRLPWVGRGRTSFSPHYSEPQTNPPNAATMSASFRYFSFFVCVYSRMQFYRVAGDDELCSLWGLVSSRSRPAPKTILTAKIKAFANEAPWRQILFDLGAAFCFWMLGEGPPYPNTKNTANTNETTHGNNIKHDMLLMFPSHVARTPPITPNG